MGEQVVACVGPPFAGVKRLVQPALVADDSERGLDLHAVVLAALLAEGRSNFSQAAAAGPRIRT